MNQTTNELRALLDEWREDMRRAEATPGLTAAFAYSQCILALNDALARHEQAQGGMAVAIAELRKHERDLRADGMDVHANTYAHAIGIIESSCHQPVAGEQGAVK